MTDRQKVLKGLEWVINDIEENGNINHAGQYLTEIKDALELLKEQEPIKPTYEDFLGNRVARCGKCNGYIVRYKYCPGCGQAVKWE